MTRKQFTFYLSFYEAMRDLDERNRYMLYEAIAEYALFGTEPVVTGPASTCFKLMRPTLDTARDKAIRGTVGGLHNGKNPAFQNFESEKENEIEKETEIETEFEIETETETETEGEGISAAEQHRQQSNKNVTFSTVMRMLSEKIVSTPSKYAQDQLNAYCRDLSPPVVCRGIEIACDSGHPSVSYLFGILRSWKKRGVSSLDDVERERASWDYGRGVLTDGKESRADRDAAMRKDMEFMRERLEKMRKGG